MLVPTGTLIVVDYVASRAEDTSAMLLHLSRSVGYLPQPVRVLLLEREEGSWWSRLLRKDSHSESAELAACQYDEPLRLGPLGPSDLFAIATDVSKLRGVPWIGVSEHLFASRMLTLDSLGRPLFGMIGADSFRGPTPNPLAEQVEVAPGQIKRRLVPNPAEIPTHNEVVEQYVARQGAKAAARDMNQRGYRYRNGQLWTKDLVLKVIEETAAIGTYVWGKGTPEPITQKVDPIIDTELFEMAQRVRGVRDPKKNPGRTASSPLLLAGLVVCGKQGCGASYQVETSGKTSHSGVYEYRYYNCRNHLRIGNEKCAGFRVRAEVLERAVLEHLADRLFTVERCKQILRDIVDEAGMLRQKAAEHRRQVTKDLEHVEKRISKWQDAFEADDKTAIELGAERVTELKAKRDELQQTLRKVVLLRPPPPSLYTEATIARFQNSIRSVFLSNDNALTRNYLRFLVDKIVVDGAQVRMVTRSEAVVRMMAAGSTTATGAAVDRDRLLSLRGG